MSSGEQQDETDRQSLKLERFRCRAPLNLSARTFICIFDKGETNSVGQLICSKNNSEAKVKELLDSGTYELSSKAIDSPISLALLNQDCHPVMKLMAERNADFGLVGGKNRLGIPDTLFVAMYHNPCMIPFLLKVGGMCLTLPVSIPPMKLDVSPYCKYVCCELGRFRGMLQLLAEFSLILPLCKKCNWSSGLESSIPSLQSICRMTYRAQFSSSELLVDDLKLSEYLPELYSDYIHVKNNPFDSQEFLEAMVERNPEEFKSPCEFLVPGEDVLPMYSESDDDYFWDEYYDESDDQDAHGREYFDYDDFDWDDHFSDPEFDPEEYL